MSRAREHILRAARAWAKFNDIAKEGERQIVRLPRPTLEVDLVEGIEIECKWRQFQQVAQLKTLVAQ